jgi:hypothetical protein
VTEGSTVPRRSTSTHHRDGIRGTVGIGAGHGCWIGAGTLLDGIAGLGAATPGSADKAPVTPPLAGGRDRIDSKQPFGRTRAVAAA